MTAEITRAWGIEAQLIPVSNDPVRTRVRTLDGRELAFQEYFVRERHDVSVESVTARWRRSCQPGPGVIDAIREADVIVIAPSNPVVSIDPVLAVQGVREEVVTAPRAGRWRSARSWVGLL